MAQKMSRIPWGPIRPFLKKFTFSEIKVIAGLANIDMPKLAHLEQCQGKGSASKSQLLSGIDKQINENNSASVVAICCEEILTRNPYLKNELEDVLLRVGWKLSGTTLLPVEIFDSDELQKIPDLAHKDIQKAASRLRDGDLSGSLSASCGAIDIVANDIYQKFELGDHNKASFQEKIKKSIKAVGIRETLQSELEDAGWKENDITKLLENIIGSLNQAAFVMQKLRSGMSDVHGTKPVISAIVYDSIKWSLLVIRILGAGRK